MTDTKPKPSVSNILRVAMAIEDAPEDASDAEYQQFILKTLGGVSMAEINAGMKLYALAEALAAND